NARLCCRSACSSLSASEAPGLISQAREIGMIRSSLRRSPTVLLRESAAGFLAVRRVCFINHPFLWTEIGRRRAPTGESASAYGYRRDAREVPASLRDCPHQ